MEVNNDMEQKDSQISDKVVTKREESIDQNSDIDFLEVDQDFGGASNYINPETDCLEREVIYSEDMLQQSEQLNIQFKKPALMEKLEFATLGRLFCSPIIKKEHLSEMNFKALNQIFCSPVVTKDCLTKDQFNTIQSIFTAPVSQSEHLNQEKKQLSQQDFTKLCKIFNSPLISSKNEEQSQANPQESQVNKKSFNILNSIFCAPIKNELVTKEEFKTVNDLFSKEGKKETCSPKPENNALSKQEFEVINQLVNEPIAKKQENPNQEELFKLQQLFCAPLKKQKSEFDKENFKKIQSLFCAPIMKQKTDLDQEKFLKVCNIFCSPIEKQEKDFDKQKFLKLQSLFCAPLKASGTDRNNQGFNQLSSGSDALITEERNRASSEHVEFKVTIEDQPVVEILSDQQEKVLSEEDNLSGSSFQIVKEAKAEDEEDSDQQIGKMSAKDVNKNQPFEQGETTENMTESQNRESNPKIINLRQSQGVLKAEFASSTKLSSTLPLSSHEKQLDTQLEQPFKPESSYEAKSLYDINDKSLDDSQAKLNSLNYGILDPDFSTKTIPLSPEQEKEAEKIDEEQKQVNKQEIQNQNFVDKHGSAIILETSFTVEAQEFSNQVDQEYEDMDDQIQLPALSKVKFIEDLNEMQSIYITSIASGRSGKLIQGQLS